MFTNAYLFKLRCSNTNQFILSPETSLMVYELSREIKSKLSMTSSRDIKRKTDEDFVEIWREENGVNMKLGNNELVYPGAVVEVRRVNALPDSRIFGKDYTSLTINQRDLLRELRKEVLTGETPIPSSPDEPQTPEACEETCEDTWEDNEEKPHKRKISWGDRRNAARR